MQELKYVTVQEITKDAVIVFDGDKFKSIPITGAECKERKVFEGSTLRVREDDDGNIISASVATWKSIFYRKEEELDNDEI